MTSLGPIRPPHSGLSEIDHRNYSSLTAVVSDLIRNDIMGMLGRRSELKGPPMSLRSDVNSSPPSSPVYTRPD